MAMTLSAAQRQRFREALIGAVTYDGLEIVMSDKMNITSLSTIVRALVTYELQCHDLILWAERGGQLEALCRAFQTHPKTAGNMALEAITTELLQAGNGTAAGGAAPGRKMILNRRPFLDRSSLWTSLQTFSAGADTLDRLLVVSGPEASGKSYSQVLMSAAAAGAAKFVLVEVSPPREGELDATGLATAIADRLWTDSPMRHFDDFGQQARDAKWYGDRLVARLAGLDSPMWLTIDGLNTVQPGPSAIDLLTRLCRAIEFGECPKLWLAIIGLEASRLGPSFETVVAEERAKGPTDDDIAEFVRTFAQQFGRPIDDPAVQRHTADLRTALGAKLSHAGWTEFHRLLAEKCRTIKAGG
jgi:hypothetical protein